ncbi:MAG: putative N-acetylglucosamine kinase [Rhodobacteraceae bacterium HLUCCA12]|nr:MAG: putative N-acetylglucosamine kinase [Rhodobacteraceae bacterium HLUCCA12]
MAFVGIDMGGTATRWVLLDGTGAPMARGTAPGATALDAVGANGPSFVAALDAVRAAVPVVARRAHLGLTGAGLGGDATIAAICGRALGLPADAISLETDIELAWRAAFGRGPGHLVLAGTGSVGMTRNVDGAALVIGGHGALIDDAGSAAWIALRALRCVLRRLDETGRAETPLAQALFAAIGGHGWDAVRRHVYGGDRGRIGLLARAVATAADDDAEARAILERAADELARLARILRDRGAMGADAAGPLVFAGGVLALHPAIAERLSALLPDASPAFKTLDAALAAAHFARESA